MFNGRFSIRSMENSKVQEMIMEGMLDTGISPEGGVQEQLTILTHGIPNGYGRASVR
jgi:hypothetical protein